MNERIKNPDTRDEALKELGEWVKDTCILMGSSVSTAYSVAAAFVGGLEIDVPQDERND